MSEHYEPWEQRQDHIILDSRGWTVIVSDRDWAIMKHLRRIVACVNACEGIDSARLEEIVGNGMRLDTLKNRKAPT